MSKGRSVKKKRERAKLEPLEPRVLFSADGLSLSGVPDTGNTSDTDLVPDASNLDVFTPSASAPESPNSLKIADGNAAVTPSVTSNAQFPEFDNTFSDIEDYFAFVNSQQHDRLELVFVDASVDNAESLIAGLRNNAEVAVE